MGSQAVIAVSNAARLIIIGRTLDAGEFGRFSIAFAAILGCQVLFLGLIHTPVASLAGTRKGLQLRKFVTVAVLESSIVASMLCAILVAAGLVVASPVGKVLVAAAAVVGLSTLRYVGYPLRYALLDFRSTFILDCVWAGAQLIALVTVFFALDHRTAVAAIGVMAIAEGISLGGCVLLVRPYLAKPNNLSKEARDLWNFGKFSVTTSFGKYILRNSVVLILGSVLSPARLAGFAASKNLVRLSEPMTFALGNVLRSESASLTSGATPGPEGLTRVRRTFVTGLILSAGAVVVIATFQRLGYDIVFAGRYGEYRGVLWILCAFGLLDSLSHLLVAMLDGAGSPDVVMRATVVSGIVGLMLIAALSHLFGVYGAAAALVASSTIYGALLLHYTIRHPVLQEILVPRRIAGS
ncbi:MAG: polysaccharide biosynthesis C-terminal domain-containing protein [Gemmatimonadota bacterium]